MKHFFKLLRLLCIIIGFSAHYAQLKAESVKDLQAAISSFNRGGICPSRGTFEIYKLSIYCKPWCEKAHSCDGSTATDPCQNGSGPEACREFANGMARCFEDMNEKNKTINAYNAIIRQCYEQRSRPVREGENALRRFESARQNIFARHRSMKQAIPACGSRTGELNELTCQVWKLIKNGEDGLVKVQRQVGESFQRLRVECAPGSTSSQNCSTAIDDFNEAAGRLGFLLREADDIAVEMDKMVQKISSSYQPRGQSFSQGQQRNRRDRIEEACSQNDDERQRNCCVQWYADGSNCEGGWNHAYQHFEAWCNSSHPPEQRLCDSR